MIIITDASDNGYGAVLEQHIRTKDGSYNKRPIEYFSKSNGVNFSKSHQHKRMIQQQKKNC